MSDCIEIYSQLEKVIHKTTKKTCIFNLFYISFGGQLYLLVSSLVLKRHNNVV
jgi:hypothetical protein